MALLSKTLRWWLDITKIGCPKVLDVPKIGNLNQYFNAEWNTHNEQVFSNAKLSTDKYM